MNEIKIFSNPQFGEIRTAMTENGEPMFCLADVCKVLDLTPSKVAQRLTGDVLSKYPLETAGGIQQANFVNEDGLYDAILDSRKEEAKIFRKWITKEVLPSIRKHGAYMTQSVIERTLTDPDYLIQLATALKEERQQRILAEKKAELEAEINKVNAPKVLFAESLKAADRSILVGELAKILKQNGYETGQKRLFKYLRDNGYLMKSGNEKNQPTQRSMEMGLFEMTTRTIAAPDGLTIAKVTTKVTVKGQEYFINKLVKQFIRTK